VVYAEGSTGLTRIYTNSQPEVKVTDGGLTVSGLSEGDRVEVYTLDGHRVYTSKATGSHAEIPVAPNKVYIVRINDQTFKVCL
jgi:formylmethanofuran dehydrogenase subunit D